MRLGNSQITIAILLGLSSACLVDGGTETTAGAPDRAIAQRARQDAGSADNRAALVINDRGGCALFDGDGNLIENAESDHTVVTSAGVASMECKISGVPNSTGHAVHYDINNSPIEDLECQVLRNAEGDTQFTPIWHETVSASGVAILVCQVRRESR